MLNSGAYLDSLIRTRIGNFNLKDAMTMQGVNNFSQSQLQPQIDITKFRNPFQQ